MEYPVGVFVSAFLVAAFSGLAALLRSTEKVTVKGVLSAILNSGMLGAGIALLWYTQYQDNVYFLVGVCLLSGLGGMATVDFVLTIFRRGAFGLGQGGFKDKESKDE